MKKIKSIFLLSLCVVIGIGCGVGNNKQSAKIASGTFSEAEANAESEPFILDFTGVYTEVVEGPESGCEEPYLCRIHVDFEGSGIPVGNFTGRFVFCGCGPEGEYGATDSYLVTETGDTLLISCQGKVNPGKLPDHPEFVNSYWKDPFQITGGTGRFAGATGEGETDDYNSNNDTNSHHHWEGTISLAK